MELKKQKTLSLKDSFIRRMEKDILSGRLSVGQKLPSERELAERFAVSKAVIHAGILEMEESGFVLVRPRVGTFVSDFRMDGGKETLLSLMNHDGGSLCAEEVKSFNEFHCALDNMVILLSEHRMDTENYKKLDRAVEGIRNSQNPVEAADYNFRFHHALALVSGNTLAPLFYTAFKSTFTSLWERYARKYGIQALYHNSRVLLDYIHAGRAQEAISWNDLYADNTTFGEQKILEE